MNLISLIPYSLFDRNSDHKYGFLAEDYFNEMLCLERKRTERSNKPILLMLLNVEKILSITHSQKIIRKIAKLLMEGTRAIDIKGWYKHNAIIGVIFTEIEEETIPFSVDNVIERINDKLKSSLYQYLKGKITITYHVFPENFTGNNIKKSFNLIFFPDISRNFSWVLGIFLKRAIDVMGSILGLVLFSPVFLIVSILIKLSSEGPVFFKQERIGQFGKRFTLLKFRTMYVNNNDIIHVKYVTELIKGRNNSKEENNNGDNKCVYKIKDDPRIFAVGKFLRKLSLDELPQLINVLKGDMSLVGPRPPVLYEFEQYNIWHKNRLIQMKPGITGLWQIKGRSSTTFDEMVRLDLKYVREWSLWLDIKIIFQTPWAVLSCKGAY